MAVADRSDKLASLLECLGEGADRDFAEQVLIIL